MADQVISLAVIRCNLRNTYPLRMIKEHAMEVCRATAYFLLVWLFNTLGWTFAADVAAANYRGNV